MVDQSCCIINSYQNTAHRNMINYCINKEVSGWIYWAISGIREQSRVPRRFRLIAWVCGRGLIKSKIRGFRLAEWANSIREVMKWWKFIWLVLSYKVTISRNLMAATWILKPTESPAKYFSRQNEFVICIILIEGYLRLKWNGPIYKMGQI